VIVAVSEIYWVFGFHAVNAVLQRQPNRI